MQTEVPWQLRLFEITLKKKQRLKHLTAMLGQVSSSDQCLLVTCGDNNGAINYHLRTVGGQWRWAELQNDNIAEMSQLLGEKVTHVRDDHLPYETALFDIVVSIDCFEHLVNPAVFMRELKRVLNPNGRVLITVPMGRKHKLINLSKRLLGMSRHVYGHMVDGYSFEELKELLETAHMRATATLTFSRFFTEAIELMNNFLYVKVKARKNRVSHEAPGIAPVSRQQVGGIQKFLRLYSYLYPALYFISSLDRLVFFTAGYVIIVEGKNGS